MVLHSLLVLAVLGPVPSPKQLCDHLSSLGMLGMVEPTAELLESCELLIINRANKRPQIADEVASCIENSRGVEGAKTCFLDEVTLKGGHVILGFISEESITAILDDQIYSEEALEPGIPQNRVRLEKVEYGDGKVKELSYASESRQCIDVKIDNIRGGQLERYSCSEIVKIGGAAVMLIKKGILEFVLEKKWPFVRIRQSRGSEPIDLVLQNTTNRDRMHHTATPPWSGFVRPGEYLFFSDQPVERGGFASANSTSKNWYIPSRRFMLTKGRAHDIRVTPRTRDRARAGGVLLGIGLPALALIPLLIPFNNEDMSKTSAAALWTTAGILAGGGVIGGLVFRFSASRVEMSRGPIDVPLYNRPGQRSFAEALGEAATVIEGSQTQGSAR